MTKKTVRPTRRPLSGARRTSQPAETQPAEKTPAAVPEKNLENGAPLQPSKNADEPETTEASQPAERMRTAVPPVPVGVAFSVPPLVQIANMGYVPQRPEVFLGRSSRDAIKRLALSLDVAGAKLDDGTLVKNSVSRAICWLCEQYAAAVQSREAVDKA